MKNSVSNLFFLMFFCGFITSTKLLSQEKVVLENNLFSTILKKNVKFNLHLPVGFDAKKRYPSLYCVRADYQIAEKISTIFESDLPKMIVIDVEDSENREDGKTLSFLEQELIPVIEKKYRANNERTLYDNPTSGSFALFVLLSKPELFKNYLASSHVWYEKNNDFFTNLAKTALQKPAQFKDKKLFLSTMHGIYDDWDFEIIDAEMQKLLALLETKTGNKLDGAYQVFDNIGPLEIHNDLLEGLKFVFNNSEKNTPKLTMEQTINGKWVILDSQKIVIYDVFLVDNGPDYASEGLIRIVKDGKIGFADAQTFALKIEPQFDCAFPFEGGKAKVSQNCQSVNDGEYSIWRSDNWKFVDKNGQKCSK